MKAYCLDCGRTRVVTCDTQQCHECWQAEREHELDAMEAEMELPAYSC